MVEYECRVSKTGGEADATRICNLMAEKGMAPREHSGGEPGHQHNADDVFRAREVGPVGRHVARTARGARMPADHDDIDRLRKSYSELRARIIAERDRELVRIAASQTCYGGSKRNWPTWSANSASSRAGSDGRVD